MDNLIHPELEPVIMDINSPYRIALTRVHLLVNDINSEKLYRFIDKNIYQFLTLKGQWRKNISSFFILREYRKYDLSQRMNRIFQAAYPQLVNLKYLVQHLTSTPLYTVNQSHILGIISRKLHQHVIYKPYKYLTYYRLTEMAFNIVKPT